MTDVRHLAEQLVAAARDITDVKSAQGRIERASKLADDLRVAIDRAELPAFALAAMHDDGLAVVPSAEVASATSAAKRAVENVRASAPADPGDESGHQLRAEVDELRQALRAQATATWRRVGLKSQLVGRNELLAALMKVPAFAARASTASRLAASLVRDLDQECPTATEYRLFRETLADFETAFEAFDLSDVQEARLFLLKSANGTATVADITSDVREWLRRHDLESFFVVRPGRG